MTNKRETAAFEEQTATTQTYWRSLDDRGGSPTFSADEDYEYTPTQEELETLGLSRRKFVTLMGASTALMGLSAAGCIRKPVERILPYNRRPEDLIPGKPNYFATARHMGRNVQGLIAVSHEGRPTKIEGNPQHPMTLGGSDSFAQASVLDLYDPDRLKKPRQAGRETTWEAFFKGLEGVLEKAKSDEGQGLALLVEENPSPTFHALLAELKKKYPKSRVFLHDLASPENELLGLSRLGIKRHHPHHQVDKAKRILSVGADFLGMDGDSVLHSRLFSKGRDFGEDDPKVLTDKQLDEKMNRLYVAEANFTVTGMAADHRLRVRASEMADFLAAIAGQLLRLGVKVPAGAETAAKQLKARFESFEKSQANHAQKWDTWIKAVADDLKAHAGASLVFVGEQLPAKAHALGMFINHILGNIGVDKPLQLFPNADEVEPESLDSLAEAVKAGSVESLLLLGGNPVYTTPADTGFSTLLDATKFSAHLTYQFNETSALATWALPMNHYLESWGDLRATDGTVSIQQPLIAPMFGSLSALELLAHVVGDQPIKGYDLVRAYWKAQVKGVSFDRKWRRWLHDGVIKGTAGAHSNAKVNWGALAAEWNDAPGSSFTKGFEFLFTLDNKVHDGRFANNAWLQELPDPLSKLTWDNAAWINAETARKYKLDNGEWIAINVDGKHLDIPVYIVPGLADETIVLPMGYGRSFDGRIAKGAGFNVMGLRSTKAPHFASGGSIKKLFRDRYVLASTQEHGRPETSFAGYGSLEMPKILGVQYPSRHSIVREASLDSYQKDPKQFEKMEVMPKKKLKSLWKEPNERFGHQWGMTIDLTKCNGCNTCVVACQSENNISVVGKERVRIGREMHWIRIDRYFKNNGDYADPTQIDDVEIVTQPMGCVHCENAPCESVCPVAATVHTPTGMNDMAYNRCIGTRYCSNNCPYKVRRFNFFNYSKENNSLVPALEMQRNPDVTVRFRGVMEKCSYCVQRVNAAVIDAKANGNGYVKDGDIVSACGQACPSDAIVFGNINDPNARVTKLKNRQRNYAVLAELNNHPRTTYLARIRNRNPKLRVTALQTKQTTKKVQKKAKAKSQH